MTVKRKFMALLASAAVLGGGLAVSASTASAACYNDGGTYYCFDRDGTQVRCYWDAADSKNVCVRILADGTRQVIN